MDELLQFQSPLNSADQRLHYFISTFSGKWFSRKEYMDVLETISSSTASRDLKMGVKNNWLVKKGDKRNSRYKKRI
jgi:predicted HTH transcriptional regulator